MSKPSDEGSGLPTGREWVHAFASKLGVSAPTDAEFEDLLALAGIAAHSSERIAAPVACWLAARAGLVPVDAMKLANEMVDGS